MPRQENFPHQEKRGAPSDSTYGGTSCEMKATLHREEDSGRRKTLKNGCYLDGSLQATVLVRVKAATVHVTRKKIEGRRTW